MDVFGADIKTVIGVGLLLVVTITYIFAYYNSESKNAKLMRKLGGISCKPKGGNILPKINYTRPMPKCKPPKKDKL